MARPLAHTSQCLYPSSRAQALRLAIRMSLDLAVALRSKGPDSTQSGSMKSVSRSALSYSSPYQLSPRMMLCWLGNVCSWIEQRSDLRVGGLAADWVVVSVVMACGPLSRVVKSVVV